MKYDKNSDLIPYGKIVVKKYKYNPSLETWKIIRIEKDLLKKWKKVEFGTWECFEIYNKWMDFNKFLNSKRRIDKDLENMENWKEIGIKEKYKDPHDKYLELKKEYIYSIEGMKKIFKYKNEIDERYLVWIAEKIIEYKSKL